MYFFSNIFNKKIFKNIIILTSGTLIARIISILFSPIIARIYGPEAFGVFGIFNSIIGVLSGIVALTYPIAIVLPKKDREAKTIAKVSIYCSFLFSLCTFIFLFLFRAKIQVHYNLENSIFLIIFVPFIIFISGITQVFDKLLIRKKLFSVIAKLSVFQTVLINIIKSIVGTFYPYGLSLIFIQAIMQLFNVFFLFFSIKKRSLFVYVKELFQYKIEDIKIIVKYKDFPVYRTPQILLNSFSENSPTLILGYFFGPEFAGFYLLSQKLLNLPANLIGRSISMVFFQRASEANNNNEDLYDLLIKATLGLSVISFIPFLLIFFLSPMLFNIFFGNTWLRAGLYARWMSLWNFSAFINKPSIQMIPIIKNQKSFLVFTIFSMFLKIISLLLGNYVFLSDLSAIIIFSSTGFLLNVLYIWYIIIKTKNMKRERFQL